MNGSLNPDVATSVQKVVKHINGKHPDTVLFLARHAAGVHDALDAQLLAVDAHGVDVAVRQPQESSTARLEFASAINIAPDFRLQLRRLLDTARAAAPDEPLTSLEEVIESRPGTTASTQGSSSTRHDR